MGFSFVHTEVACESSIFSEQRDFADILANLQ